MFIVSASKGIFANVSFYAAFFFQSTCIKVYKSHVTSTYVVCVKSYDDDASKMMYKNILFFSAIFIFNYYSNVFIT